MENVQPILRPARTAHLINEAGAGGHYADLLQALRLQGSKVRDTDPSNSADYEILVRGLRQFIEGVAEPGE